MPDHPKANDDGYIFNAAVNIEEEMVEMLEASRQYQNNIEVISTFKSFNDKNYKFRKSNFGVRICLV